LVRIAYRLTGFTMKPLFNSEILNKSPTQTRAYGTNSFFVWENYQLVFI
jgi:hypothetical protein